MTETPSDIIAADNARAQAILDAFVALTAAIEADNIARTGRGGPLQSNSSTKSQIAYMAGKHAQDFNLPYDGPTIPTPGQPTGGE